MRRGNVARRDAYLLAGATASGKSAVAALLAREMGAAILNADSMLVYKGMDIGTAKPSPAERVEFPLDAPGGLLLLPGELRVLMKVAAQGHDIGVVGQDPLIQLLFQFSHGCFLS